MSTVRFHPSIPPSVRPSIHPFHPSAHAPMHSALMHPPNQPTNHPSIHPSMHPSLSTFLPPSIYRSIAWHGIGLHYQTRQHVKRQHSTLCCNAPSEPTCPPHPSPQTPAHPHPLAPTLSRSSQPQSPPTHRVPAHPPTA